MNEMEDYRNYRDYREDYRNYRDGYRENYRGNGRDDFWGNPIEDYRENYRGNYRDDFREDYRDYDRRGGKVNNRSYRNYREDYHQELQTSVEDMRKQYRKLEDVAEMAENPQEKNMLMRIAQKSKENYMGLKQMMEK